MRKNGKPTHCDKIIYKKIIYGFFACLFCIPLSNFYPKDYYDVMFIIIIWTIPQWMTSL